MAATTVFLDSLASADFSSQPYKAAICKETSQQGLCARMQSGWTSTYSGVKSSWTSAVSNTTMSHLSVSLGYTLGRQLKTALLTIERSDDTYWAPWSRAPRATIVRSAEAGVPRPKVPGYPGVKLASRLAGRVMQLYLDSKGQRQ